MARLTDLHAASQTRLRELDCPTFDTTPWVAGPAVSSRRAALISSAALITRGQAAFLAGDAGWRPIPHDAPADQILMSHVSVNFDRTGFMLDLELVLPRRRLDELVAAGRLGSVSRTHYSFMGSNDPKLLDRAADEIGGQLRAEQVDAAILVPV
jgi:D-proline reductase (dithiol) PrdB